MENKIENVNSIYFSLKLSFLKIKIKLTIIKILKANIDFNSVCPLENIRNIFRAFNTINAISMYL